MDAMIATVVRLSFDIRRLFQDVFVSAGKWFRQGGILAIMCRAAGTAPHSSLVPRWSLDTIHSTLFMAPPATLRPVWNRHSGRGFSSASTRLGHHDMVLALGLRQYIAVDSMAIEAARFRSPACF